MLPYLLCVRRAALTSLVARLARAKDHNFLARMLTGFNAPAGIAPEREQVFHANRDRAQTLAHTWTWCIIEANGFWCHLHFLFSL